MPLSTSWITTPTSIAQEAVNPLVPAGYDLAFSIVPLVLAAITIVGLVSIVRRYAAMSAFDSVVWTAFVVIAPIVGTLVWFAVGRKHYTTPSPRAE